MGGFISEDDLKTFDGWMRYQALDVSSLDAQQLQVWKNLFDDIGHRRATRPKVGLMKLRAVVDEHRYAVALRDGRNLWLALWIRRSAKGEFFVMHPTGDRAIHTPVTISMARSTARATTGPHRDRIHPASRRESRRCGCRSTGSCG